MTTATGEELRKLVRQTFPKCTNVPLTLNCRNTRNIGEATALLSGFASPPYRLGQVSGVDVDYFYYPTAGDQCALLAEVLRNLLLDHVKASDIVILSPLTHSKSGVAALDGGGAFRILEIGESAAAVRIPVIRFATIHAFKGMESPVVILCDVATVVGNGPQSLLYVAMSRARSHLTIIAHEQVKCSIDESRGIPKDREILDPVNPRHLRHSEVLGRWI